MFVLFNKRLCGPIANTLFNHRTNPKYRFNIKIEKAYDKADTSISQLIDFLQAAWLFLDWKYTHCEGKNLRELSGAPEEVKTVLLNLPEGSVEEVSIDDEVSDLADEYISAKVLGPASITDALHVAAATVTGADLIVSWNFKHIVSFNRIRGYNSVNTHFGYRTMTILSPKEASDENEDIWLCWDEKTGTGKVDAGIWKQKGRVWVLCRFYQLNREYRSLCCRIEKKTRHCLFCKKKDSFEDRVRLAAIISIET